MFIWPDTSESSVLTISFTIFIHIIYVIVWVVMYGLLKDSFQLVATSHGYVFERTIFCQSQNSFGFSNKMFVY